MNSGVFNAPLDSVCMEISRNYLRQLIAITQFNTNPYQIYSSSDFSSVCDFESWSGSTEAVQ